jgi:hypothetical protein
MDKIGDVLISKLGEVIFTENPDGKILVKSEIPVINKVEDFIDLLSLSLPKGVTIDTTGLVRLDPNIDISSQAYNFKYLNISKRIVFVLTSKKVHIYFKSKNTYTWEKYNIIYSYQLGTVVNTLNLFKKIFSLLTESFFIKEKIKFAFSELTGMEVAQIYKPRWGRDDEYVVDDYIIRVDKNQKIKLIGTFHEDEDAGREWTETIESKQKDIERLKKEIDFIHKLQTKLNDE